METNIAIATINIFCGILFIAISVPLMNRKIKMNNLYGFRISKAFESEKNWFDINEYGAKQLIIWSLPIIVIGIICFFIPTDEHPAFPAVLGAGPATVFSFIAIVKTARYAKNL
ncbi:MAG: SdpI family protein [Syntrophotaleaceae bacterium]